MRAAAAGRLADQGHRQVRGRRFHRLGHAEFNNLNITNSPTSNIAVRKAMQHGVDRRRSPTWPQRGLPAAAGLATRGSWAYWKGVEDMYPYDVAKAKQILDDAGWKVGSGGIRARTASRSRSATSPRPGGFRQKSAEFIQASLQEIGFDYVVDAMPYEATVKRFVDNEYEAYRLSSR